MWCRATGQCDAMQQLEQGGPAYLHKEKLWGEEAGRQRERQEKVLLQHHS